MAERRLCLALALLVLPMSAFADRHKAGVGAGPRYADRSTLWGFQLSGEVTFRLEPPSQPQSLDGWTRAVAFEAGYVSGEHEGASFEDANFLVGLRLTRNRIGGSRRVQPFGQALIGVDREKTDGWRSSFASAFGAGVDVPLGSLERWAHPEWALRAQVDRYWKPEGYTQITVSFVYRINHIGPD